MKFTVAILVAAASMSAASAQEAPSPFAEPSVEYLGQFAEPHKKVFVLERYDAQGKLHARDLDEIRAPVEVIDAIRRKFNGIEYVLRGLTSCPSNKVTYNRVQTWDCNEAAKDDAGTIYNKRASVVLCKTLVLQSTPGKPDPVSCFARVGEGSSSDPFLVANDDDSMVFQGFAQIALDKEGRPLRPDLLKSAVLGKEMGLGDARQ
jgi:hypothetical protein